MRLRPLVSIIMPSYNSSKTIRRSIDSIIAQSYDNWELLVTDDKSSDDTLSLLKNYAEMDERIKVFVLNENGGAGVARNNSIYHASGRYIAFLDSDDEWHPKKLQKQIKFMLDNKYALTYTAYRKIDGNNNLKGSIYPPMRTCYSDLLKSNVIGCLTAIYDTELLGKIYMPVIRKRQDMALWLLILEKIDYAWCLNDVLAYYREGHESLSSNKLKILKSQWGFYRDYLKYSLFKSAYYFSFYLVKAYKKHNKTK
ncbi:glycosyltransferase family 2 protein [Pseudocitrobacter cyperus]|uniref:Glycosyltransferase family 2 protein n=1 Tax=Pseudocitrobacter cyperus TaxID=3112843 RepID=A0ABV0HNQ2_9ENTR